jgi:MoaA/NifB/PqqE/SkfB family radical SAM enzyme
LIVDSVEVVIDSIRTIKLLSKWSANRIVGRRRPLIAVFSLTHYCNFYCPMCPFGDADKDGQMRLVRDNDLTTDQWKYLFNKVSEYCIWSIIEGGEPTSRPDFMDLVRHLYKIKMPITVI